MKEPESIVIVSSQGQHEAILRFKNKTDDRIFSGFNKKSLYYLIERYLNARR